jgi:hypothetical protein
MLKSVPLKSLDLHSSSGSDWNGHLFIHEGGHYRMISQSAEPFYESLLSSGIFADLAATGLLIDTERAEFSVEGTLAGVEASLPAIRKWAVLEFIPKEDEAVKCLWTPNHRWYSHESCLIALRRHFDTVDSIELRPSLRTVLVCRK